MADLPEGEAELRYREGVEEQMHLEAVVGVTPRVLRENNCCAWIPDRSF